MISFNNIKAIDDAIAGDVEQLYRAFYWESTPQGDAYWRRLANDEEKLTDEALAILKSMRALPDECNHRVTVSGPDVVDLRDYYDVKGYRAYDNIINSYVFYFADINDAVTFKLKHG